MQSKLIDLYRSRFGEAVKGGESALCVNGPCPECGGNDRCVVWADKRDGLGKTCTEHGLPGVWWCRQCGAGGDTVAFLMSAAVGLEFKAALAELGIEGRPDYQHSRPAPVEETPRPTFAGRSTDQPSALWLSHAKSMAETCTKALAKSQTALRWLAKRGITPTMAERYGLGLLEGENGQPCRFRARSSFGLPPAFKADGKQKKLWMPRGISIPSRVDGEVVMFRVRRPNGDLSTRIERDKSGEEHEVKDAKYWELPGGQKVSFHLPPSGHSAVTVYMVVEGEFDAMLLHAVAGESIGTAAMRNASNKPDAHLHAALARADLILVALDSDTAGASGLAWWQKTYAHARPCPIPGFKDPGEAYEAGFDLRLWLETALPRSVRLAPSTLGIVEACSGSELLGVQGGAAEPETPSLISPVPGERFQEQGDGLDDLLRPGDERWMRKALPDFFDLEAMPRVVLAMASLWRMCPVHYHKFPDGGWEWVPARPWTRREPEKYDRFMRLADTPEVAEWLAMHEANDIDGRNFLTLYGG